MFYLHVQTITPETKPLVSTMPITLPPLPTWMAGKFFLLHGPQNTIDLLDETPAEKFSLEFSTAPFQINGNL